MSERQISSPQERQLVAVSEATVDPATSAYLRDSIWWQREFGQSLQAEHVAYGINQWRKNGFLNVRLSHVVDPAKSPLTAEGRKYIAKLGNMPSYARLQEYGIDFTVTPGKPVYCNSDRIVLRTQVYRPWLVLFRTWDFGWLMPAAVYYQVQPFDVKGRPVIFAQSIAGKLCDAQERPLPGDRLPVRAKVHLLREVIWREILLRDFANNHVLPCAPLYYPNAKLEDFGDPAGNQHDDKSPETSIQILATLNPKVVVRSRVMSVDEGIDIFQCLITAGDVEADPVTCKTIVDGIRSGYVRDDDGFPLKDGFYEHILDAVRYGVGNVFRLQATKQPDLKKVELARIVTTAMAARCAPVPSTGLSRPSY